MRQWSLAVSPGGADRHLIEQVRAENMCVIDVPVIGVLRLDRGEIWIDGRRSEGHQLIGRPVNVAVNTVFTVIKLVIDPRIPLHSVPRQGLLKRPTLGYREIAGQRSERSGYHCTPCARTSCHNTRSAGYRGAGQLGREFRYDQCRDIVWKPRLH